LKSGKKGGGRTELERNYQAGGRHGGMSLFVDLEAGHLEIGSLIDESAILCSQGDMFGHRHVESTAISEGTSVEFFEPGTRKRASIAETRL
jgi:hypothetical protein